MIEILKLKKKNNLLHFMANKSDFHQCILVMVLHN